MSKSQQRVPTTRRASVPHMYVVYVTRCTGQRGEANLCVTLVRFCECSILSLLSTRNIMGWRSHPPSSSSERHPAADRCWLSLPHSLRTTSHTASALTEPHAVGATPGIPKCMLGSSRQREGGLQHTRTHTPFSKKTTRRTTPLARNMRSNNDQIDCTFQT